MRYVLILCLLSVGCSVANQGGDSDASVTSDASPSDVRVQDVTIALDSYPDSAPITCRASEGEACGVGGTSGSICCGAGLTCLRNPARNETTCYVTAALQPASCGGLGNDCCLMPDMSRLCSPPLVCGTALAGNRTACRTTYY